jgi:hypothetical protein
MVYYSQYAEWCNDGKMVGRSGLCEFRRTESVTDSEKHSFGTGTWFVAQQIYY